MKKVAMTIALIAAGSVSLAACGGGGGSGPNIGIDYEDASVSDAAVNTTSALLHTGGEPPLVSRSDARSQQVAILDQGNTVYLQLKAVYEDGVVDSWRHTDNCRATGCNPDAMFQDYEEAFYQPVMTKNGIQIAKSSYGRTRGDGGTDREVGYGGWMEYSLFGVELWSSTRYYEGETWLDGAGVVGGVAGYSPRTNPTIGPFVWHGVMVGRISELESSFLTNAVQGDATVEAELARSGAMSVDVMFSSIKDLTNGNALANMTWDGLPVVAGSFNSPTLIGSFFGPQHEEVGGSFDRNSIIGAFGAQREGPAE